MSNLKYTIMKMNEKIKSIEDPFVTVLEFRTKEKNLYIDEAMLAVFPLAAWNEVPERSTFESKGLCHLLLVTHFENGDDVYRKMAHEFDVFDEHCVQLTIFSAVKPILRRRTFQQFCPSVKFSLDIVEQDLFSKLM